MTTPKGPYSGSDSSDSLRAEVQRLRADAAQRVVQEIEAQDARLAQLEEWRTNAMIALSKREELERRIKLLEDAAADASKKQTENEKFQTRASTWGTAIGLAWPVAVAVASRFIGGGK